MPIYLEECEYWRWSEVRTKSPLDSACIISTTKLNQGQGGMCICRTPGIGQERFRPQLQHRPAAPFDLAAPAGQPGEEAVDPLLYRRPASQAQIAGGLLPRPALDRLIPVEVRAVARQVHQPQLQSGRPEIFPHRLATVRRGIVPDHVQLPRVPLPQLV